MSNLRAVQQELDRLRRFLVVPHSTSPRAIGRNYSDSSTRPLSPVHVLEQADRVAQERRATQLARFRLVNRLQAAGHNASAIMRETGRGRTTNIVALQRFVRTLRRDLGAAQGAVRERWSNGPVEGHINRLKMLRRQMSGRAGVELLRARLLPAPSATLRKRPLSSRGDPSSIERPRRSLVRSSRQC